MFPHNFINNRSRRLGCSINENPKEDRQRHTEEAGNEIERLLGEDPPLHKEEWHRMKGWYKAVVDRASLPARANFERITAERVDLYRHVPLPGENIPVSVELFQVE